MGTVHPFPVKGDKMTVYYERYMENDARLDVN